MPVVKIVPMPGPSGDGAGFNFRGEWATDTLYLKNDVVTQNGSSYIANYDYQSAQGPDQDGDLWAPLALKGEDGTGSNSDIADFVFTTVEDPDYESTMSVTNNDMVLKTVVNTEASGNIRIESAQNIVLNADGDAYIGDNSSENNRVATIGDIQAASTADFIFTDNGGNSTISLPGDKGMRIEAGPDSDLYVTAGDDLYIQTLGFGDDIFIQAADDIRFTAGGENEEEGRDGTSYGWNMNSEGEFHLPGSGYISNPNATVVTSGNRYASYADNYLNSQSGLDNVDFVALPVDLDSTWFVSNLYSGIFTSPVVISFADGDSTTAVAIYDATSQGTPAVIFQWNDLNRQKTFEQTFPLNISVDFTTTTYDGTPTIVLDPADNGDDQVLVVEATAPNHIHLRAGGVIDQSTAELFLGGEDTHVRITDQSGSVEILGTDITINSYAVPSSLNINTYNGARINSARTSSYSDEDKTVATLGDIAGETFTFRGEWNDVDTYPVDHIVVFDGESYISIQQNTVVYPPDTTYWTKIAAKGADAELPTGATGSFISNDNKTVTVTNGIIVSIEEII